MNHFFLWFSICFILSLSIAIVSDLVLIDSCSVAIVSISLFMRSVSLLCDLSMSPSPSSNQSRDISGNVLQMDRTVSKLIARMPFNWLKSVGWFIPHFSAKARSESPENLIMSLIRSIIFII